MAIDLDVNSFTELNNNIIDINNKTAPLANMVLNPVPVGSTNKLAVKRGTTWNIEGEEVYNGRVQNFGDISGNISLDMDGAGCRTAMIAEVVGDTFITGFGDNFSSGVVYVLFLRQDSIGGHSVRWPYGASILGMTGTDPDQLTEVYIVKLPNGKVFIKCKAFQNTVEIGSIIKEFEYPASTYPEDGGNAPISFTWAKNPEIAYGGTLAGLYSDWEVASDELFTVLMFSSYGNTVDLYSIEVVLSQSGLAYMRTRYGGEIGGTPVVSPWEQMSVQVSGVPPLWTPSEITTALWIDASQSDTITDSSGVSRWDDVDGSIYAQQGTVANRPVLGTDVVSFDGANDNLYLSDPGFCNAIGSLHIFMTGNIPANSGTDYRRLFAATVASGLSIRSYLGVRSNTITVGQRRLDTDSFAAKETPYTATGNAIVRAHHNWQNAQVGVAINGADISYGATGHSSGVTAATNSAYVSIGGVNGDTNQSTAVGLYEMVCVIGELSDANARKIEGYLAHKWGLVANLPADHPYKYAPPRKFTGSGWDPSAVDMDLWLDAGDRTTLDVVASRVSQWRDKSGKDRHADSVEAITDPYFSEEGHCVYSYGSGLRLIGLFNGIADGTVNEYTLFAVARPKKVSSTVYGESVSGVRYFTGDANHNGLFRPQGNTGSPSGPVAPVFSLTTNGMVSTETRRDLAPIITSLSHSLGQNPGIAFFERKTTRETRKGINGSRAAGATGSVTNLSWLNFEVPTWYTTSSKWNGDIYEIILVFSGSLEEEVLQKIEGYLAHKWDALLGITTITESLPSDHPYKLSSPSSIKYETDTTTIIAGNLLEGTTGLAISKVNGDALNLGVQVAGTSGGLFQVYANGSWTFYPNDEFGDLFVPDTLDSSASYHTTDGVNEVSKTLTVTVSGASGIAWTPSDITTAQWLDAADGSTIVFSTGSYVQTWQDKSGNSRHMTQTGGDSLRPILVQNALNSLPVLRFDGSNDWLSTSALWSGNQDGAAFVVYTPRSTTTLNSLFGQAANTSTSATWRLLAVRGNTGSGDPYFNGYGSGDITENNTPTLTTKIAVWTHIAGVTSLYRNSALVGSKTQTLNTLTGGGCVIGRRGFYNDQFLNGDIAEIVAFTSAITNETMQKIEGYLAHKWGLVGDLPADHPYKNNPPMSPPPVRNYKYYVGKLVTPPAKYFPLDEESGTTIVEEMGTVNGSYSPGVTLAADQLTDHPCPKFTPSLTGYGNLGFNTSFPSSFGISLWVKLDKARCEVGCHILNSNQYFANSVTAFPYKIWYNSTNGLQSALSKGVDFNTVDTIVFPSVADLTPYHVLVNVVSNEYHEMYINGVLLERRTLSWAIPSSGLNWLIGQAHEYSSGVGKSAFCGWLSDIIFRAEPFTTEEIAILSNPRV
ncbi:MAG: hypothetical protein RBR16_09435 [Syntrophus sp. (in: bacteria)]|nr:hypothetical protein [Syntrophus sp. (in: bacteria)]